ncbi:hypothetical protein XENTR_v10013318 [Xenopus tropicalis]|nr:hypothetical protein XENTR_v10013318 [Xenopus tropicalis]KAE8600574.1 hypothetical protein XENTR_v10013318 [Xenopus tropicalis]
MEPYWKRDRRTNDNSTQGIKGIPGGNNLPVSYIPVISTISLYCVGLDHPNSCGRPNRSCSGEFRSMANRISGLKLGTQYTLILQGDRYPIK